MFEYLHTLLNRLLSRSTQAEAATSPQSPQTESELIHADDPAHPKPVEGSAHLVPYDENLLERTRTQWRQGDWGNIVHLDMNAIEHHPERAKLGLIVASAWLQQGDDAAARHYLRHALDWGCDKKLAAQLLVAGVHNSLGRAAAINGEEARMDHHFRGAVAGSGAQTDRISLGRRQAELLRLPPPRGELQGALSLAERAAPVHYPPHGITSYAQNLEDVMLWRALWDVENGFYIDVGTCDPMIDSVSKAFYELGWRGFHVEPQPEFADKIRLDRPDEKVFQVLMGNEPGKKRYYYIPDTGLSTTSRIFVEKHQKAGLQVEEHQNSVITLEHLLECSNELVIHWLKIDFVGMEDAILAGWKDHPKRPWIILIKAIESCTTMPNCMEWEHHLLERGYQFVYFDGLNRFYLHSAFFHLRSQFSAPPNVSDNYEKYAPTI